MRREEARLSDPAAARDAGCWCCFSLFVFSLLSFFFFFNDTATTEIYTLPYTTLFRSICKQVALIHCQTHIASDFGGDESGRFHNREIGRAGQQECRDRSRMPSSAW